MGSIKARFALADTLLPSTRFRCGPLQSSRSQAAGSLAAITAAHRVEMQRDAGAHRISRAGSSPAEFVLNFDAFTEL